MDSAQPDRPEPSEDAFIDAVVDEYIQKQIAQGEAAGKSQAEIEQSLNVASLVLTVKMLREWNGGSVPEGAELLWGLADLTGASDAECRDICRVFVAAGWLDASYCLTDAGRSLAGLDAEPEAELD